MGMLAQAKAVCRELGLTELLITCPELGCKLKSNEQLLVVRVERPAGGNATVPSLPRIGSDGGRSLCDGVPFAIRTSPSHMQRLAVSRRSNSRGSASIGTLGRGGVAARTLGRRVCADYDCSTVLSTYNSAVYCWLHAPPAFRAPSLT
jgi:hypothetical protein